MTHRIGDIVRTTTSAGSNGWSEEALKERRRYWGKRGVIIGRSNAHGECFEVRFENGHVAWYEPQEIR